MLRHTHAGSQQRDATHNDCQPTPTNPDAPAAAELVPVNSLTFIIISTRALEPEGSSKSTMKLDCSPRPVTHGMAQHDTACKSMTECKRQETECVRARSCVDLPSATSAGAAEHTTCVPCQARLPPCISLVALVLACTQSCVSTAFHCLIYASQLLTKCYRAS